ncbi:hypothetical protein GCM10022232_57630 [Streptomyces plumbiresistens]|uniref:Uncharacterized protein n=1 Tax=Streptomyces plumbiresistens TaxID=511811 RepID=A0ABP7SB58_9ACTN
MVDKGRQARVYYDKGNFGLTEPCRPIVGPEDEPLSEELEAYHTAISTGDGEGLPP